MVHTERRYNEVMKRSGFQIKPRPPLKRTILKAHKTPQKRRKLRKQGKGKASTIKRRIQALLRMAVIQRDGGCILRVVLGGCNDTIQCEHLITRSNSNTFADLRNCVALCQYHHIFWKPSNGRLYWELIEQHLGTDGWEWLKTQEKNKTPYKINWAEKEQELLTQTLH